MLDIDPGPKVAAILKETIDEITAAGQWPDNYVNKDTHREYTHLNSAIAQFVEEDTPRYALLRGGEGGGKSVAGIMKTLGRLRRGMSGAMVSPNLPHFRRSLWAEFVRWVPLSVVIPEHRRYFHPRWQPRTTFNVIFYNELGGQSVLICGGAENPLAWEGPNISFCHVDEARGMDNDEIIKVMAGRVRIPGPRQEPPQLYITTTPRMNFLYDYFGPIKKGEDDPYIAFKERSIVLQLRTEENIANLDAEYVEARGAALTEQEKRVRLGGEWEDEDNANRFLESMVLWDVLKTNVPPLKRQGEAGRNYSDVLVVALDAAVSRDSFGLVGVSRHWDPAKANNSVAVRVVREWRAPRNGKIDFQGTPDNMGPELFLRWLCENYVVVCVPYDLYQLHDMATRLSREGVAWFEQFSQVQPRTVADQQLYDLILDNRLAHDGDRALRQHINNADSKLDNELHKRRLVKRQETLKIDLAVALSMATYKCLELNLH